MEEQYLKQIIELQKQVIELQKELLLATKQMQQAPAIYPQFPSPPVYPYTPSNPIWVIPPHITSTDIIITDTGTTDIKSSYTGHLSVV